MIAMWACRPGDDVHRLLRLYKDGPVSERRARFTAVLATALRSFVARHEACIRRAVGPVDAVAIVPSSRPGALTRDHRCHPLASVVQDVAIVAGADVVTLARGTEPAAHLRASRRAFAADGELGGRRVLMTEDTWVTGARARSAAAAVTDAGGVVVGMLVLGRAIDPTASAKAGRWWLQARRETAARPDDCGLQASTRWAAIGDGNFSGLALPS
ncbi:MAG TPA: hypothetical protein VE991_05135 [Acidimicrobiales bacterium]|nr:hypothetical protein [Acidimicrobiales bacterium]